MNQHGLPLVVDGKVGDLTWWSLNHPKPDVATPSAIDYLQLPSADKGGSAIGRAALAAAIGELRAGAREVGGNNRGPRVKKYLALAGLDERAFVVCVLHRLVLFAGERQQGSDAVSL
jgi:hypothetical protein